jgi:hypothetical protein
VVESADIPGLDRAALGLAGRWLMPWLAAGVHPLISLRDERA